MIRQCLKYVTLNKHALNLRRITSSKTAWPECVRNTLSVQQCKNKVDNDIADYFSGTDKQITAQIIRPRQATDEDNYNWVVIPTYEVSGRVNGIYFNGMVFYDL